MPDKEQEFNFPVFYTNTVRFQVAEHDFSMLLGLTEPPLDSDPGPKKKEVYVRIHARVLMSPTHFKRFINLGTTMLEHYEKTHGKIKLQPTPKTKKA